MKKYTAKDFKVIEFENFNEYKTKKDIEIMTLNNDRSITVFVRYRMKNGKFKTRIENI